MTSADSPAPVIRPLDGRDVPAMIELCVNRGWPREERKLRLLFDEALALGVDGAAGSLDAAVTLAQYGSALAVVGMLLVRDSRARQGLGRALMNRLIAEAGPTPLMLGATEMGLPLYEQLGFRVIGHHLELRGQLAPGGPNQPSPRAERSGVEGLRPFQPSDLADVLRLDAEVVGADRSRILSRVIDNAARVSVLEHRGAMVGLGVATAAADHHVVGPLAAPDAPSAAAILTHLADDVRGPVRVDPPDTATDFIAWATASGLTQKRTIPTMLRGAAGLPGDRRRLFAPASHALG